MSQTTNTESGVVTANRALTILTDSTKLGQIKLAIGGGEAADVRKTFDTYTEAKAVFDKAAAIAGPDFAAISADESVFGDGIMASVSLLGVRLEGENGQKGKNGAKAIVLIPIPTLEAFAAEEKGADWLRKIVEKESAHVAFRPLREAETVEELTANIGKVPTDVLAIVESHTRDSGVNTVAYDLVWPAVRAFLKANLPAAVFDFVPNKASTLKAIRSAKFAREEHALAEERGLFNYVYNTLLSACASWKNSETGAPEPLDSSAITEMWEARTTFVLPERQSAEKDESALVAFDFSKL
jgi:hypothetical protein